MTEEIFEEIMSINFKKFIHGIHPQIQKSQQTLIKANKKKATLKHMIIKTT